MSFGIAVYPEDGTSIEGLLQKADRALYKMKHQDKNALKFARALLFALKNARRIELEVARFFSVVKDHAQQGIVYMQPAVVA